MRDRRGARTIECGLHRQAAVQDHGLMSSLGRSGLFGRLFDNGQAGTGDQEWLQAMLDVEAALARALERAGLAAQGSGSAVTAAARADLFDIADIGSRAALTGNPVPAVVRALSAGLPPDAAAAVHRGATSQDIIDSAAMLIARSVLDAVLADLADAAAAAARLAETHRNTVMIGRTLLQQAVPVTFGLVAAGWLTGIDEARQGLGRIRRDRLAVQFGGAAGTLAALGEAGPQIAALLAQELGLPLPVLPWHADRLRIIELASALAGASAVLGKIARDVTLLAQSEVAEVREGEVARAGEGTSAGEKAQADGDRQGGSSSMPHKRNPVAAVVILGCTRQVPGLLATVTASAEQEHQRAAGAWHAEWQPLSSLLRLTASAASWAAQLLAGLEVDAGRMRANLDAAHGLPLAESVVALLAPALGRLQAGELVAEASELASATGRTLAEVLVPAGDARHEVSRRAGGIADRLQASGLTPAQIEAALGPASYLGAAPHFVDSALAAHHEYEFSYGR
jgi:3-carboxy-cis,cis-muconate cycloisomerase